MLNAPFGRRAERSQLSRLMRQYLTSTVDSRDAVDHLAARRHLAGLPHSHRVGICTAGVLTLLSPAERVPRQ
ncbi:hypothetical protein MPLA_930070 [Mesorhizobium sp. ORS 3359]|nr:hypothetical protein MPLA_930070 [Mesorhizobium sp. ORS 3359]